MLVKALSCGDSFLVYNSRLDRVDLCTLSRHPWEMTAQDVNVFTLRSGPKTLTCSCLGGAVYMSSQQTPGTLQHWSFEPVDNVENKYRICVSSRFLSGLDDPDARYLTADKATRSAVLAPFSSTSEWQVWTFWDASVPIPIPQCTAVSTSSKPPMPMSQVMVTFRKVSVWSGGFHALVTLANHGKVAVSGWSLTFQYAGTFMWLSDVEARRLSNGRWEWKPSTSTKTIVAGGSINIAFGGTFGSLEDFHFKALDFDALVAPACGLSPLPLQWPDRYMCQYVDVLVSPTPSVVQLSENTRTKIFILGPVLPSTEGEPMWGGVSALDSLMVDQLCQLRHLGGDAVLGFGGGGGRHEAAQVLSTVDEVVAFYLKAAHATQCKHLEFDIEDVDRVSIVRRNQALAKLQAQDPSICVSLCLEVLPTGLTKHAKYVLQHAHIAGVCIDSIRLKLLDASAPDLANAVINSIVASKQSISQLLRCDYTKIGFSAISNDPEEEFDLDAANALLGYALRSTYVHYLCFWSTCRNRLLLANKFSAFV